MKRAIQATILAVLSTALGMASAQQVSGNWSVYANVGKNAHETLVQTHSLAAEDQASAKLSVVCSDGKLSGIAMTMASPIADTESYFNGDYETTQVSYLANGKPVATKSWFVLDGGQTLAPFSEVFESKANHEALDSLLAQHQLGLEIPRQNAGPVKVAFDTTGLAQALATAGCK